MYMKLYHTILDTLCFNSTKDKEPLNDPFDVYVVEFIVESMRIFQISPFIQLIEVLQ